MFWGTGEKMTLQVGGASQCMPVHLTKGMAAHQAHVER